MCVDWNAHKIKLFATIFDAHRVRLMLSSV